MFREAGAQHEVRVLRGNLKGMTKNVEELRAEISHQSDRYNDLWFVHGTSLEEVQKLRSEVIALRSGVRVESVGGWLGARTGTPRVLASSPGSGSQPGRPTDCVESSGSWHERSRRWSADRGSGRRRG